MARTFGATPADVVVDITNGRPGRNVRLTVWTAQAGSQITALEDLDGRPLPGYVVAGDNGAFAFRIPQDTWDVVWARDPAGRWWQMISQEILAGAAGFIGEFPEIRQIAGDAKAAAEQAQEAASKIEGIAINVRAYGATGDGVTDDTDPFQQAMDALDRNGGGTLVIPPGTYRVASADTNPVPLYLRNHLVIEGYGATLTKAHSQTFRALFTSQPPAEGAGGGYGSTTSDVIVRGIRFKGTFGENGATICPFAMHHVSGLTVEDCIFEECQGRSGHILDLCGCEKITVRRNKFLGIDTYGGADSEISEAVQLGASTRSGVTSGTPTDGVVFDGLMTRDVLVEDNQFLPYTAEDGITYPCGTPFGTHALIEGRWYERAEFRNNLVQDPMQSIADDDADDGRHYYRGVIHLPTTHGIRITGNTFIQTQGRGNRVITAAAKRSGILATSDFGGDSHAVGAWATPVVSTDIEISGNQFIGWTVPSGQTAQEIIYLRGVDSTDGTGDLHDIVIRDNAFRDAFTTGATNKTAVFLQNMRRANVVGNKFGNITDGVRGYTCHQVSINDNQLDGVNGYPVFISVCDEIKIDRNLIRNFARGIQFGSLSGGSITANTIHVPTATGTNANGIVAAAGNVVSITDNEVINEGAAQPRGIAIAATLLNSKVSDNIIVGYTAQVSGTADPTTVIRDNLPPVAA